MVQAATPLTGSHGAGSSRGSLGSDKLLQLAGSLSSKQLARAPEECGEEELMLHIHILQACSPSRPCLAACLRHALEH